MSKKQSNQQNDTRERYLQQRKQEIKVSESMRPGLTAQEVAEKHRPVSSVPNAQAERAFAPSEGSLGAGKDSGDEAITQKSMPKPKLKAAGNKKPLDPAEASYGKRPVNALLGVPGFEPEKVVGTDDRTRRTDTELYPWHCVCSLLITDDRTGLQYLGTGWLVSPRVVLTAGHCVYIYDNANIPNDTGAWASKIEVTPGRDASERPFGSVETSVIKSNQGWTNDHDTRFDYGAIILPETHRYGDQLGWFGYAAWDDEFLSSNMLNLSGYPGDKELGTQWFHKQRALNVEEHELTYEIDTFGGQSGAPVWIKTAEGHRYGVGIHKAGHATASSVWNSAKRITQGTYDNITNWVAEAP